MRQAKSHDTLGQPLSPPTPGGQVPSRVTRARRHRGCSRRAQLPRAVLRSPRLRSTQRVIPDPQGGRDRNNASLRQRGVLEVRWELEMPSFDVAFFFFQAEDGIRDYKVTGVQTCALPI